MPQILFSILLAVCLSQTAFSQKFEIFATPKIVQSVNDYAQMINPEVEKSLSDKLDRLSLQTKPSIKIALVTVNTTGEQNIIDASLATAREWSQNNKALQSDALLIFIAKDDRKYFTQTSKNIRRDMPDETLGDIQRRFFVPAFRQEQYAKGITEAIDAIITGLAQKRGFNATEIIAPSKPVETFGNVQQMILVTTPDWNSVQGKLQRFERKLAKNPWRKVGGEVPIVIGKSGLAWGEGLHEAAVYQPNQPIKREGDSKSPAGIFKLTSAFGTIAVGQTASLKMPYTPLADSTECVDDVKSGEYNMIADRSKTDFPDWNSSEKMLAVGEQYALGVFVAHNFDPVQKGKGSCIFLHIWKNAETGTAGCTAMKRENMSAILQWLDVKANPVLVQLPKSEFDRLRKRWKLPQDN